MKATENQPGFVMYGAEFSLYSGKLRSYLRKKGIEFTEIQPWLMTYKRFIVPRTGVRYIPVLQTPEDDVWQDTTVIIDHLEERFPQPTYLICSNSFVSSVQTTGFILTVGSIWFYSNKGT